MKVNVLRAANKRLMSKIMVCMIAALIMVAGTAFAEEKIRIAGGSSASSPCSR